MTHYMNLVPSAFKKIANGSKTIELRLNDEKRKKIQINDTIVFHCVESCDIVIAKVQALYKFENFKGLYEQLPLEKCGYADNELSTAHYTDIEQYYSKEQIEEYGALGIELYDVCAVCDVKGNVTDTGIIELLALSVYDPTPERLLNRARKYQESDKTKLYAYLESGKYIGIVVFKINEQTATIFNIAVKPEHQGRGIGSKLADFVFDQFDIARIIAETDDDAIGFYQKSGFVITDTKIEFGRKRYTCIKTDL